MQKINTMLPQPVSTWQCAAMGHFASRIYLQAFKHYCAVFVDSKQAGDKHPEPLSHDVLLRTEQF